jgi:UDPglucose--hexose-1-phosphate uridylyltransferase
MSLEPEFRRDPVCGRWAIVAPQRSLRPHNLEGAEPRHRRNGERTPCPFCPGQEHDTPHEVLAYREPGSLPDGPGWQLRSVPNKFPAVTPGSTEPATAESGLFQWMPAQGRAEVIIECPEHLADPTLLSAARLAQVFRAYRERIVSLAEDPSLGYASVLKNVGAEAGASLGHTHSQIIATPLIPESIAAELAASQNYITRTGRCLFCDLLQQELTLEKRLIARSHNFVAFSAYAPRYSYEFWVLPLQHSSRYETSSDAACLELSGLLQRVLRALDSVAGEPAYNWYIHTGPLRSAELSHYHWHLEVLPRTARPAGLEWGFGCFITAVSPEQAAHELRQALACPD